MVPQRQPPSNDPSQQTQHIVCGAARAQADPGIADALARLLATPLADWPDFPLTPGSGTGWHSPNWRGHLGQVEVAIELFREDTLAARTSAIALGSRGQRRHAWLQQASGLGLPTVAALAHGSLVADGKPVSFVLWRLPAGAQPWSWNSPPGVLRQLGSLLRRCLDLGLRLPDLRPEDLGVDAAGQVFCGPIRSLQQAGIASIRTHAAWLAGFCGALDGGPLDPAASDLLHGYEQAPLPLPESWRASLALASQQWRRANLHHAGRNCLGAGTPFATTVRRRGQPRWLWRTTGAASQPTDWHEASTRSHWEQWLQHPPPPDKSGRRGAVWLQDSLVVKQRAAAAAGHLWQAMHWLQFAGVATPTPLALCWHRGHGHVFAARVANVSLADELADGRLDPAAFGAIAASLGNEVGRLHAHGLRNRDLKFENLIRDPADGRIYQIDLDGVRRKPSLDTRGIGRDLGRLLAAFDAAGSPGGLRMLRIFLRAWLRAHRRLLRRPACRRILQQAARRAAEWRARHQA